MQSRTTIYLTASAISLFSAGIAAADFHFVNFDGPTPNGGGLSLRAMNNEWTLIGAVFDADFNQRGYARTDFGVFSTFPLANGSSRDQFQTQLGAINDLDVIATYLPTVPGAPGNPPVLIHNGTVVATIPLPAEFGNTIVRGLTNAGVIAGTVNHLVARKPLGFVRDVQGHFTTFAVNETTLFTEVEGINRHLTVVGNYSILGAFTQGFLRTSNGEISLLPTPATIGGKTVFAIFYSSINDSGMTAGSFQDDAERFYGFVRDARGNFTLVQNPANPNSSGVTAINNHGTLAGTYLDENNVAHGYFTELCPSDIDRDGEVGLIDLAFLLIHFGTQVGPGNPGDLDADGRSDLSDVAIMLAHFGTTCP